MAINDGGPAFPDHIDKSAIDVVDIPGMTLRDWFASHAPLPSEEWITKIQNASGLSREEVIAHHAFKYADAMLKAREE